MYFFFVCFEELLLEQFSSDIFQAFISKSTIYLSIFLSVINLSNLQINFPFIYLSNYLTFYLFYLSNIIIKFERGNCRKERETTVYNNQPT